MSQEDDESIPLDFMHHKSVNVGLEEETTTFVEIGGMSAEECIRLIEKSDVNKSCHEKVKEKIQNQSWHKWILSERFSLKRQVRQINIGREPLILSTRVPISLNLLQLAVIKGATNIVESILLQAEEDKVLDEILEQKIEDPNPDKTLLQESKWIFGANVLHLAAQYSDEALALILNRRNDLKDSRTKLTHQTPLHIAATYNNPYSINQLIKAGADVNCRDNMNQSPLHIAVLKDNISTSLLVAAKANVNVTNDKGQTPLHIAVQNENMQSVVALLDAEKINVLALDNEKMTSIHHARTSKMTDILLVNVKPESLRTLEGADDLFQTILKNHPTSMNSLLNLMISSNKEDLSAQIQEISFDFSLFGKGTKLEDNFLTHHLRLIKRKQPGYLRHPIMSVFANLQWSKFKYTYVLNCVFFALFLIVFNLHAFNYVDLVRCNSNETCSNSSYGLVCHKQAWKRNTGDDSEYDILEPVLECYKAKESLKHRVTIHTISKYVLITCLVLLSFWEMLQFLSRLFVKKILHYFNKQNLVEFCIYLFTTIFLYYENNKEIAGHFLGWALLFTWLNFTLFLSISNSIGKRLFMSFYVMREVVLTLLIYVPTLLGFASAFHCFLYGATNFHDIKTAVLATMIMLLGNVPWSDFQYPEVDKVGGRNVSAQLAFLIFIIVGCIIIMNLLIAAATNQKEIAPQARVILEMKRIEEITGMVGFGRKEKRPYFPVDKVYVKYCKGSECKRTRFEKLLRRFRYNIYKNAEEVGYDDQIDCESQPTLERLKGYDLPARYINYTMNALKKKQQSYAMLNGEIRKIQQENKSSLQQFQHKN